MLVFIGYHHLLYDLIYVFVGIFHCAIHLRFVWRRVMMLNLELHAEFSDHDIVEVGTIVSDDPLRDSISTCNVMLDESSHHILGN